MVKTDITVKEDVKNLFAQVKAKFGRSADVLLANAVVFEEIGLISDVNVND
jgi:NAD(P)-dependent dehydrogenase (short-subunit alcohol dehydrogenase family)